MATSNQQNVGAQPAQATVVVCAETAASTAKVIPHAMAVAAALDAGVLLVHVIEPQGKFQIPFDPFEWDLRRREAENFVNGLSAEYTTAKKTISTRVLQGRTGDQICACALDKPADIAALCRSDIEQSGHIGQTARRIMEQATGSILMVPATVAEGASINYRRVLVPLDGSARAESALSFARRIATSEHAELVLVHAIPEPQLTEIGPLEQEDIELKAHISSRNKRVGKDYLARIRQTMTGRGLSISTVILEGGDARRLLNGSITTEAADILVLSSHGDSGYADVPSGDVAGYIMANSAVPVLMVRRPRDPNYASGNGSGHGDGHVFRDVDSKGIRHPNGAP
jgi:nucleotide-binding universal stress UspA family protein